MASTATNNKDDNKESEPTSEQSLDGPFKYGNIDITQITCDPRRLRIYLDGVFDMTHYGHFRLFKNIKAKFPNSTVIVGVSGDEETIRLKGQTVMNEQERTESIEFCRYVDEVICPCPWIITQPFIDEQNIDYVAHDGLPYISDNKPDIYDFVKKQGRFIATQRTTGVSTTGMINRIICRYNEYVLRNLKRGLTRKDMNVSWTRQKRIEMKHQMDLITDNVTKWMDEPHSFIEDFMKSQFGEIAHKIEKKIEESKQKFDHKKNEIKQKFVDKKKEMKAQHPTLYFFGVGRTVFSLFIVVVIIAFIAYRAI